MNDKVKRLIEIGYNNNLLCYDSEAMFGEVTDKLLLVMHENAGFKIAQIYIATVEQKDYYLDTLKGTFPRNSKRYRHLLIATNQEEDKAILGAC